MHLSMISDEEKMMKKVWKKKRGNEMLLSLIGLLDPGNSIFWLSSYDLFYFILFLPFFLWIYQFHHIFYFFIFTPRIYGKELIDSAGVLLTRQIDSHIFFFLTMDFQIFILRRWVTWKIKDWLFYILKWFLNFNYNIFQLKNYFFE